MKDSYDSEWNTTRRLTREEKVALRRHGEALKERTAYLSDRRTRTRTEFHDEHILTQTGYAFWSAVGYQSFHLRNCSKLNRISELHGYARFQDAIRVGLTPCRECKPSPKFDIKVSVPIYQRERQDESVDVFHINLVLSPNMTRYHKQHRLFLSLTDTFEYIKRHEKFLVEKMKAKERNNKQES